MSLAVCDLTLVLLPDFLLGAELKDMHGQQATRPNQDKCRSVVVVHLRSLQIMQQRWPLQGEQESHLPVCYR